MTIDKQTLLDIGMLHPDDGKSVMARMDHAVTNQGKKQLTALLSIPLTTQKAILERQASIAFFMSSQSKFPATITNGTLLVLEKFYAEPPVQLPMRPRKLEAATFTLLRPTAYSWIAYFLRHAFFFLKDMRSISGLIAMPEAPAYWAEKAERITGLLSMPELGEWLRQEKPDQIAPRKQLVVAAFLLYRYKRQLTELIADFAEVDAFLGLAKAMERNGLVFPEIHGAPMRLFAEGMFHPLLDNPVPYKIALDTERNFLFLTGANMAGKSTFIKTIGLCAYLAHVGMGVPARRFDIGMLDGILTNIQNADDITSGESYFFNEVARAKHIVSKLLSNGSYLVLMDEIFKGTNMEDAMKCTLAVAKGLCGAGKAISVLSTHLYEIADEMKDCNEKVVFRYFATSIADGRLSFGYELKEGVSNERLGYWILKQEGVEDMLLRLSSTP